MDIASMLEVEVKELPHNDTKENMTPMDKIPLTATTPSYSNISPDEQRFYQLMFGNDISSIRFRKLHCTACDAHIGSAPSQAQNMYEHPILRTLLCASCREFYGDGTFEQGSDSGDDETDMFCRWCANGGNLYCCSHCSNTFCNKCIKRNFDSCIRKKIEADEKWKCFVCDPTDLYPLRSMCRAIIQHVHTATRLLHNDRTMSPKEKEEKMHLDESPCCPRKRKRRRKKTGSDSEDDELYQPTEVNVVTIPTNKRRTRHSVNYTNGVVDDIEDDEDFKSPGDMYDHVPLLHCEQSMVESENEIVGPDGSIIKSSAVQQKKPSLLPSKKIVAIPTAHLINSGTPVTGLPRKLNSAVTLLPNPRALQQQQQRAIPPMVTIPKVQKHSLQKHSLQKSRPRMLLPKPGAVRTINLVSQPSVINLESDDDDLVVIDTAKNTKTITTASTQMDVDNVDDDNSDQEDAVAKKTTNTTNRICNKVDLKQLFVDQNQEIEHVLGTLRRKVQHIVNQADNEEDVKTASTKVRRLHAIIHRSMSRLAEINDVVINDFRSWEKSRSDSTQRVTESPRKCDPEEEGTLPLEMSCSNESDSEEEEEKEKKKLEEYEIKPSDFQSAHQDLLQNFVFFRKRHQEDRGVGNDRISPEDKGVQVDDVERRDYEKCIGYALLMKAEYDQKTNSEILKPVRVPDEFFGKYHEQFVFHLQHIEDHGINTEEHKGLPDPNETPLKELIEANSPFISEMLESIGTPAALTNGSCREMETLVVPETFSKPQSAEVTNSKAVDDLVEMVTKLSNDIGEEEEDNEKKRQEKERTPENKQDETTIAVQTLIEDENSGECEKETQGSDKLTGIVAGEDECTVID